MFIQNKMKELDEDERKDTFLKENDQLHKIQKDFKLVKKLIYDINEKLKYFQDMIFLENFFEFQEIEIHYLLIAQEIINHLF